MIKVYVVLAENWWEGLVFVVNFVRRGHDLVELHYEEGDLPSEGGLFKAKIAPEKSKHQKRYKTVPAKND